MRQIIPGTERFVGQTVPGVGTDTVSTYAQELFGEQLQEFYRLTLVQTTMLKEAYFHNVKGPKLQMSNLLFPPGQLVGGLGERELVAAADMATPVFDDVEFTPKPFEMNMPIGTKEFVYFNIEQQGIIGTLQEQLGIAYMNDLELQAISSDTLGSTPAGYHTGNLTTVDGWMKKGLDGHVYDRAGGYVSPSLFLNLFQKLPVKWRSEPYRSKLRFFCPPTVVDMFNAWMVAKNVFNLSDFALVEGNKLTYSGIPLVPVPLISVNQKGVLTLSGTTSGLTSILLTAPENLVVAYEPQMTVHVGLRPEDGKVLYTHLHGLYDFGFVITDWVAEAPNVVPQLDPTLLATL